MAFVRPGAKKVPPMSRAKRVSAMDSMQRTEEENMKLSKVYKVLQRIRHFLHTSKEDLVREMSLVNRIAPDIPRWLDLSEQEQLEVYTGIKALERHAPTVRDDGGNDRVSMTISPEAKTPEKRPSESALQARMEPWTSPTRSKLNPTRVFTPRSTRTLPPEEYTIIEADMHEFDALTKDLLRANSMSYLVTHEILRSPTKQFNMIWHKWLNEGSRPAPRSAYKRLYVKDESGTWLAHREMTDRLSSGEVINIIERCIASPEHFPTTYHIRSGHRSRSRTPAISSVGSGATTPRESSSTKEAPRGNGDDDDNEGDRDET